MFGAPGLCAATKTAGTPARRREANESASRDAESTHCRSSTTISVGTVVGGGSEEPERRDTDGEAIEGAGGTERKRRRQGGSLGLRERVETVQYRRQHVDERRVGEIGLGLHSGRLENRHLTRVLDQLRAGASSCRCQARLRGRTPLRHRLARRRAPSQASRTPPRGRTASSASLGLSPARAGRRAPMVVDGAFSLVVPAARHHPARARNLYEGTDLDRSGEPAVAVRNLGIPPARAAQMRPRVEVRVLAGRLAPEPLSRGPATSTKGTEMRTRTRITLAGLALGAALAGGVAWATIPADSASTRPAS